MQFKALGLDAERLSVVPGKELGARAAPGIAAAKQTLSAKFAFTFLYTSEKVRFLYVITYRC